MDPSKPLPHEYEEGKLSRYSDIARQKYLAQPDAGAAAAANQQQSDDVNEHEAKIVSQYANANDSVILNKTEFREILMNALNINSSESKKLQMSMEPNVPNHDIERPKMPEIKTSYVEIAVSTDDVIYANQTIEKSSEILSDAQKKSNPISLDTPEVDKLLNEGNFQTTIVSIHYKLCW